ncbi:C45 family autoproteolytic acyltransferase/hydrolase [Singulisphaera rosea]
MHHVCFGCRLLLVVGVIAVPSLALAQNSAFPTAAKGAILQDRVVAGSPADTLEVRHIVLKGTNREIGRALATIAKDRYEVKPIPSMDRLRTRAQRRSIERNYPILFDRMRGVADVFGKQVDDDGFLFSGLWYPRTFGAGCSVVYYPPQATASGTGVVSRNYDFTTGTNRGTRPTRSEFASTGRPYVVEMYPDRGYASLAIYSYDLLSGVLDGVNSEGLTVALLADEETRETYSMEPDGIDAVGAGEMRMPRMLLDTCATAEEAKEMLLQTKKSYQFNPVHYLVADRHGNGFVWEYSQHRNRDYFIENPGKPLITTNFSLHRHLDKNGPPSAAMSKGICPRYCKVAELLEEQPGKPTVEFIKESHNTLDFVAVPPPSRPPSRTLWHALYFPEERKLQVSFYLRDEVSPDNKTSARIVRTGYLDFALDKVDPRGAGHK